MVANVEIMAKEIIKPSSPTNHHLIYLKLSFLDQIAPPVYIPLIFFYQAGQLHSEKDRAQKSHLLKQSLSNSLTQYYPLAGRISGNSSIDCNDAGTPYVEAKVHTDLMQVVENPNTEAIKQYLPLEHSFKGSDIGENILLAVQINFFDCGGIAIGVQMSHKIGDGTSLVNFMNAWAANCRGDTEIVHSNFDIACLFPPRDLSSFFRPTAGMTMEKIVTKRFVFNKEKLAKLKEAASSAPGSQVKDPTRVEAVSALIWKHFMEVAKAKKDNRKIVAAVHAVNLRPRMSPPLPDSAFGNFWRHILAIPTSEVGNGYHNLVGELRHSIRSIDKNYIKKLQSGDEYLHDLKKSMEKFSKGEIDLCNFSSWCRFPVYEVDYGWERPVWVCTATLPFKNVAILMSTRCGEGIEVWVNMLEDDAPVFQNDLVHLSLVDNSICS